MVTLAFIIVSILLALTVLLGLGMALAIWGAVKVARPELLDDDRGDGAGDATPTDATTRAGAVSTQV